MDELPDADVVASIYHRKQVEQAMNDGVTLSAEDGTNLMVEWAELPTAQQKAIVDEIELMYDSIEEASQLEEEGDEDTDEDAAGTEAVTA